MSLELTRVLERRYVALSLVLGLVISLIFNVVILRVHHELRLSNDELKNNYLEMQNSFDELNQDYLKLQSSFDELNQTNWELNRTIWELSVTIADLEGGFIGLFNDPFSAPVSKIHAVQIALEHGGWDAERLRGKVVTASLEYMYFIDGSEYGIIHKVKEPVTDYTPVVDGDTTYRYIWYVIVAEAGPWRSIPPPGFYFIDAATGERIPHLYNP